MRINKIEKFNISHKSSKKNKPEFIDILSSEVRNPKDVNDCVCVPRGIFKAYLFLMGGTALMGISNLLPKKLNGLRNTGLIISNILNFLSAIYFAKPFALKGLSPTVTNKGTPVKED